MKKILTSIFVVLMISLLSVGVVTAIPSVQPDTETNPLAADIEIPNPLSLSFRYLRTIGITGDPYNLGEGEDDYLNAAYGIGIDGSGNLYVAEWEGVRVLRYDSSQHADLILGSAGIIGDDDAHFTGPFDVLAEPDGDFWVADEYRITRWSSSGELQLVYPENPTVGCEIGDDLFCSLTGLAFDSSGRLYVSDSGYHAVHVFTLDENGVPNYASTIGVLDEAGDDNEHFNAPFHIDIDSSDNLYVADAENNRVQKCTSTEENWSCTTFHGTGEAGDDADQLDFPNAVAVHGSTLYIADTLNWRVKSCDLVTSDCVDFITSDEMDSPTDIAVNSSGDVFVNQTGRAYIVSRYSSAGEKLEVYAGTEGMSYETDPAKVYFPNGLAVDKPGNVYVNEFGGNRYLKYNSKGVLVGSVGTAGINRNLYNYFAGRLWGNPGVSASGMLYLPDSNRFCVKVYNTSFVYQGVTIGTCGTSGDSDTLLRRAGGVAVSPLGGNIYVVDMRNNKVKVFTKDLEPLGPLGGLASGSGTGDYNFNNPIGIAIDMQGNIYVADEENHRVQKFDSSGVYQDTLGITGVYGWENDYLWSPNGVATDVLNRVYVADTFNRRVQVFDSDGTYLTTIGGSLGTTNEDLNFPTGVAVASNGTVYVADNWNHRIQVFGRVVP